MHLVIFEAPTFHFIKTSKDYYLWFFMITLRWTGPNNGIRKLAPNTSKMVNKILFWINYLSFYLATAKINYEKPKTKNRDMHLLVIKENWLSGSADRARQTRRGYGFHTEPQKICP